MKVQAFTKLRHRWQDMRSTFWFMPAVIVLSAVGLATGLIAIDTTLDLLNQHSFWAPPAICGLAAGLERLTLPQADTLVTESMARLHSKGKAKVIVALGARLGDLTPPAQDKLLDAAAGLYTDSEKAQAIAGLAAGLASLDKARQDRVIDMALGLSDNGCKAQAIAALAAARNNDLQKSINLALGSSLATIGLTVPVVAAAAYVLKETLVLGLDPRDMVLLAMTLLVSMMTFGTGRTNVLFGFVHMLIFAVYLFFVLVP